jgi:hypothetical protein
MTPSNSEHGTPAKKVTSWLLRIFQNSSAVRIDELRGQCAEDSFSEKETPDAHR